MSTLADCRAPSARALLRRQFQFAHELLDAATERLTSEQAHRHPPGAAAPAGASYAQVVVCEDLSVNVVLGHATPLALSSWAGHTGLSQLPPLARSADWQHWARRVRLDLVELRSYAQAVYAATDTYLAALPDSAVDPTRRDGPACLLSALLLTLAMRRGEITCLLALEHLPTADETKRRGTNP
jgi:hypothetical protein